MFAPGLGIAVFVHALYNQPYWRPVAAAVVVLLVSLPASMSFIFWRSERALEKWVGTKLDKDIDLLQMMTHGFLQLVAGRPLSAFAGEHLRAGGSRRHAVVSSALAGTERARQGRPVAPEMGFPVEHDPELPAQLKELHWLESQIGRAGKVALGPLIGQ